MSELAGPWLNLPLMFVPGTNELVKDAKVDFKKLVVTLSPYEFFIFHRSFQFLQRSNDAGRNTNQKTKHIQLLFETSRCNG